MNFISTVEQDALREAARTFALGELMPHASRWDEEKIFPLDTIRAAGKLGFCGMYSPEKWGGSGLPRLDSAMILEELAAGCTSTAAYLSIHNMTTWMLCTWGSSTLCSQWAEAMTSGEKLGSYCLTEPDAGSDAASLTTEAIEQNDEYIVSGSKMFISGAGSTDMLIVMARTGGGGARGISAFAIPANLPGITYGKNEVKMGWNSQPTKTISFDGVRIPADNLLGEQGEGFKLAMQGLDGGRINIAACSLGTAQLAIDKTTEYVKNRQQFSQTLSDFQTVQFRLADMLTKLVAARQMVYMAASRIDNNHPDKTCYCAMAKQFATDAGFDICNQALQLHGGYGYLREYGIERLVRDVRVHQILEGTNEIMQSIVGRRALNNNGEGLR
jgi:alkylation response protein AidB-like acyl-CoA dehydrogenase